MVHVVLSAEQQDVLWERWRAGEPLRVIARQLEVPRQRLLGFLESTGGTRPPSRQRAERHLSLQEREEISRGLAAGATFRAIGRGLGRPHSTVANEVARNGGRLAYRAEAAARAADARAKRPKEAKLARLPQLRRAVEQGLEQEWSPEQISHRLRLDHPEDDEMRISHEGIYLSLFRPDKPLERRLGRRLRTGRTIRGPRVAKRSSGRGRLRNMVPITDRPAEVEGRQVPGHWEGDLVMGRRPSAVATLVERSSRFLVLVALPDGLTSDQVRPHVVTALRSIPPALRRSLTWDRGREMATHQQLTAETDCPVYFCAPRSPWQRGTNENTNGLLRQYLGKPADLSIHSQTELDTLAGRLNNRPRKVLNWRTPAEVHAENAATMALAP
jgi:IS30 family transposase